MYNKTIRTMSKTFRTWEAKEGNETFTFNAESEKSAKIACEMWNAVLIREVTNNN